MVLPVGLSYQPLVPRKMTCMLIPHSPLGQLLADLLGEGAFDLREDLKGFICRIYGIFSPTELVQSQALGEEEG